MYSITVLSASGKRVFFPAPGSFLRGFLKLFEATRGNDRHRACPELILCAVQNDAKTLYNI